MPNHTDELPAVFQLRIGPDRDMRNRVNGPIMPEAGVVGALDAIPAAPRGRRNAVASIADAVHVHGWWGYALAVLVAVSANAQRTL